MARPAIEPTTPGRVTTMIRTAVVAVALSFWAAALPPTASAQSVVANGDIGPFDDPFTTNNEGIPTSGTFLNTSGVNADGNLVGPDGTELLDEQGRVIGQIDFERSANVEIGRNSSGGLTISAGASLRYGDLTIGGATGVNTTASNLNIQNSDFGTGNAGGDGVVTITGAGSLFNNHPQVLPTNVQSAGDPEATSFTVPEAYDPPPLLGGIAGPSDEITDIARGDEAFDLYVGLTGTGLLQILDGGRAEIRDGAFVGAATNAVGRVVVDGAGSSLQVYGDRGPVTGGGGNEETLIGVLGNGFLDITAGGRVNSFNGAALGAEDSEGEPVDENEDGGSGEVLVDGQGSVWRVSQDPGSIQDATLAVGEFFDSGDIDQRLASLAGADPYRANAGRGVLRIRNGGFVDVFEDDFSTGGDDDDGTSANVRIGAQGELQLTGGRIEIANRLDNDGLIRTGDNLDDTDSRGDGVVQSRVFVNSPLGTVSVRAGEELVLRVTGDPPTPGGAIASNFANAGVIQVQGDQALGRASMEFNGGVDAAASGAVAAAGFANLVLTGGAAPVRGQIVARDANLHFVSGLQNSADVLFTGGDSLVTGPVQNDATGLISITNESHVTFTGDVVNNGAIVLNDESDVTFGGSLSGAGALIDLNPAAITVLGDYENDGLLDFVIGGGASGEEFTRLSIIGDATFGENLVLSIQAISTTDLAAGDTFNLIEVAPSSSVTDLGAPGLKIGSLPTLPAGLQLQLDADLTDGFTLTVVADSLADFGDFDLNGVVDINDYLIWQATFGETSDLRADANNDGIVDAADYTVWRDNLGTMPSVAVSPLIAAAPEPATWLAALSWLGLAGATRRARRATGSSSRRPRPARSGG